MYEQGQSILPLCCLLILFMSTIQKIKTGLYLHIPFCSQKCFFCSFVVCVARLHRADEYLDCLSREAQRYAGTIIDTVYVGGGTPTLLDENQLVRLLGIIKKNFRLKKDGEFTIETNPDTLTFSKAKILRSSGVNRVSIGAQTFDNALLKFLGRTHRADDVATCCEVSRRAGFKNVNVDMMFGFPRQSWERLEKDLSQAVALRSEHVSLYDLTIDPHSRFYRVGPALPNSQKRGELYAKALSFLEKRSFFQYEISNFAREGYASAHNTLYWECENYIGLGIGAHSHLSGRRFWNIRELYPYIRRVQKGRIPIDGQETLGRQRRLIEALLFGLRMNKGVDITRLEQRSLCRFSTRKKEQITRFVEQGFLVFEGPVLKTTFKGRLVLDELCGYLI